MTEEAFGAICLWEWDENTRRWNLFEAYEIDSDGEAKYRNCTDYKEFLDKPGRLVTGWDWYSGVYFLGFNPTEKLPSWMREYYLNTKLKKDWVDILEVAPYFATAREAKKVLKL